MFRALLIEDEAAARAIMHHMLAAHPQVRVVGEAGSVTAARRLLARDNYDLVFLDIQLVGGSGFDLVPFVRREARVIFVTAHDQHALRYLRGQRARLPDRSPCAAGASPSRWSG